ncbi:MAG: copper homeostasis protein CutC [Erysipelothrix sp.]|nr:copper homeostasis protein CutC [Erysipelothrix sp.]
MLQIEVCCGSVEDVLVASQFPITSIELNSALSLGGLTPSLSSLVLSLSQTDIPIIVMIRCRGGNFHYSDLEIEQMYSDASLLLDHGADGIAFGFLNEDNSLDTYHTTAFTKLAHSRNKQAVFHRAFDLIKDPLNSIKQLHQIGIDRLLTSGQQPTAIKGKVLLKQLNDLNLIPIMAGSGITPNNYQQLVADTQINYLHGSFSEPIIQTPSATNVSFEINMSKTSSEKLRELFNFVNKVVE